ncbi:unnamed protein product [Caenorhabditis angaria]|uniref:Beta-sarcoglycan n=1 Tax=Caenorhabditis angaria TaxID=860376 RepID=A0A9P1I908_9PELO|nr:unnamed protein product [Caenorhabditis angaria]
MDLDQKSTTTSREEGSLEDYEITGLRSKRLVAMIVCLIILFILTTLILILNIMIITTLRMDPTGIKFLRFHQNYNKQNGKYEKTVEMAGDKIQFDNVVTSKVFGFPEKNIDVSAPRILVSAKKNGSFLEMTEKYCRIKNVNNFQVLSRGDKNRTIFSARHPTFMIDKKIKQISAEKIITDKIRSAIDEDLKIDGKDVVVHGDQQVRIDARNISFDALTRIAFNVTGEMRLRGKIRFGDGSSDRLSLPFSTTPLISASSAELRLCACAQNHHKLFVVPANKHCNVIRFCDLH